MINLSFDEKEIIRDYVQYDLKSYFGLDIDFSGFEKLKSGPPTGYGFPSSYNTNELIIHNNGKEKSIKVMRERENDGDGDFDVVDLFRFTTRKDYIDFGNHTIKFDFKYFISSKRNEIIKRNHVLFIKKSSNDEYSRRLEIELEERFPHQIITIGHFKDEDTLYNENGIPYLEHLMVNFNIVTTNSEYMSKNEQYAEQIKWLLENNITVDFFGNIKGDENLVYFKMKFCHGGE